jgi:hypothetical protein
MRCSRQIHDQQRLPYSASSRRILYT